MSKKTKKATTVPDIQTGKNFLANLGDWARENMVGFEAESPPSPTVKQQGDMFHFTKGLHDYRRSFGSRISLLRRP